MVNAGNWARTLPLFEVQIGDVHLWWRLRNRYEAARAALHLLRYEWKAELPDPLIIQVNPVKEPEGGRRGLLIPMEPTWCYREVNGRLHRAEP